MTAPQSPPTSGEREELAAMIRHVLGPYNNDGLPVVECVRQFTALAARERDLLLERITAWVRDPNRRPAATAFTAGAERQLAYAVEDAVAPSAPEPSEGEYRCRECAMPIPDAALRMGEFNFCQSRCEEIHGLRAALRAEREETREAVRWAMGYARPGFKPTDAEVDGVLARLKAHRAALRAEREAGTKMRPVAPSAPEPSELGRDVECVRLALSLPLSGMNSIEEHKAASGARDAFERIIAALRAEREAGTHLSELLAQGYRLSAGYEQASGANLVHYLSKDDSDGLPRIIADGYSVREVVERALAALATPGGTEP